MAKDLRNELISTVENLKEDNLREVIDEVYQASLSNYYDVHLVGDLDEYYTASEIIDKDLDAFCMYDKFFIEDDGDLHSFDMYSDYYEDVESIVDDLMEYFDKEELVSMFDLDLTEDRTAKLYQGCWFGQQVSEYGCENNRIDYRCLANIVGPMILCNDISKRLGETLDIDEYCEMQDDWYEEEREIYQWYIITDEGANFLNEHTNEYVFYDTDLDIYVWGITHYGTGWDYVLTDIEITSSIDD